MKTFYLVIKDFLSSGKIEETRSAKVATLCLRFTSDILVYETPRPPPTKRGIVT